MGPSVRVLLFATAREAVGASSLLRTIPPTGVSVGHFLKELELEYPALARIRKSSRLFRNGQLLRRGETRLRAGDELAIHPPYSGG